MATKLKLVRANVNTDGLIQIRYDDTIKKRYGLHKPSELEDLQLVETTDSVEVSIIIAQHRYSVLKENLLINGVDQSGQTIDQISDTLSALFIDSTGGGGGTTDISTPPHVIYKTDLGEFGDSPTTFDNVANELVTELIETATAERLKTTENGYSHTKEMRFGVAWKAVLRMLKLNGIANEDFSIQIGKALQALRVIFDATAGEKKIIIGNANDIIPAGSLLLREVVDEVNKQIIHEIKDTDDASISRLVQEPLSQKFYGGVNNAGLTYALLSLITDTSTVNEVFNLYFGADAVADSPYIRIKNDPGANEKFLYLGNEASAHKPWIKIDMIRQLISMAPDAFPLYDSTIAAIAGGLVAGDLYVMPTIGKNGGESKAICIV